MSTARQDAPAAMRRTVWVAMIEAAGPRMAERGAVCDADDSFVQENYLDLRQISYMSGFRQKLIVSTRWCELAGPVHGWLYGGFMKPF